MRWVVLVSFFFVSILSFAAPAPNLEKAIQFPVQKYQLENGLTVLLVPDNSIPEVCTQQWFRVGSKDEVPGHTGLAHFFEHMMFKGTKKFPKETWGKFLNGKGAESNAFTSTDYTGFYINAPSNDLDLLLQIESDRMRNLSLNPKDVNSEREVVKEERRMRYDDNIDGGIREKMNDIMFKTLPYHWLPIGSMKDLDAASMDDLHRFYKTYYSPNNAVLVVAGAIDMEQTKKLIQKYYGPLPREVIHRPVIHPEVPQKEMRMGTIYREAQSPSIAVGYRTPDYKNPDRYALDLLSIILGEGNSSRLYRDLVYKRQVALDAYAWTWSQRLAGQFSIGATLKPITNPERAMHLIETQVRELREHAVSAKELDKAKALFMKDYVDGLKRISGRAQKLAYYEVLYGDYGKIFSDLAEYQKVTPNDIQRVAKLYLQPYQRDVVIVRPRSSGGAR